MTGIFEYFSQPISVNSIDQSMLEEFLEEFEINKAMDYDKINRNVFTKAAVPQLIIFQT